MSTKPGSHRRWGIPQFLVDWGLSLVRIFLQYRKHNTPLSGPRCLLVLWETNRCFYSNVYLDIMQSIPFMEYITIIQFNWYVFFKFCLSKMFFYHISSAFYQWYMYLYRCLLFSIYSFSQCKGIRFLFCLVWFFPFLVFENKSYNPYWLIKSCI